MAVHSGWLLWLVLCSGRSMVLPLQIISTLVDNWNSRNFFRGYINARVPERHGRFVGLSLLSSHVQRRNKKKLDILMVKIKLAPKHCYSAGSSLITLPLLFPDLIQGALPFPLILFPLLHSVRGCKGRRRGGEGEREMNPQRNKDQLHNVHSTKPKSTLYQARPSIPIFLACTVEPSAIFTPLHFQLANKIWCLGLPHTSGI